eukprot:7266464-Pyramimonas_sp.AAC.1
MAYKKFGLAASCRHLPQGAYQSLGDLGGPRPLIGAVTNLRIDYLGGRHKVRAGANRKRHDTMLIYM